MSEDASGTAADYGTLPDRVTAAQAVSEVVRALRAGADLSAVLGTLLDQVRLMLEADEAYIALREGRSLRLAAGVGLPVAAMGATIGVGLESLAMGQLEPFVLLDASRHGRYHDYCARSAPVGAFLACPMVAHGEAIGLIVATRRAPGRFGGSDLWWVQLLGGLAAVVVEHDRARRAQEHRARQAEVLLDVVSLSDVEPGTSLAAGPSGMLQRLAEMLTHDLGVNRVDVLLRDNETDGLVCLGSSAGSNLTCSSDLLRLEAGSEIESVLATGHPRVWSDGSDGAALPTPLAESGARTALAAPMVIQGRRRGVLLLSSESPAAFGPEDQAFATVLAARIGLLIEEAELRERRRELERFSTETKARQEFVGIISHELKTPVAVIQAYTDVLLRRAEKAGDAANLDVLRRVGEQVERMLHMVDQTLDVQRLEAGLLVVEPARFDLVSLARRVAESVIALKTQHRIVVAADTESLYVVADRRRVDEVLTNLLQNALKYSAEGEIAVRVWGESARDGAGPTAGGRAFVSVHDEGVGIAADEQAHVFDRFYQGASRLYRGHVGLGLGLYISREIVRRHGGEISLESRPGDGTTFTFWLPVSGTEDADA